jgi:xanthine dehydrogenase accessory factor
VKHWQEMGDIVDRVLRLDREGRRAALAIVTRIEGSAYRRPGAKLLVLDEGNTVGGVSGGCLEQDVREVGLQVLHRGRSRTLHYDTYDDDTKLWGFGLGCDGKVDVLVQPVVARADRAEGTPWPAIHDALDGDGAFAVSVLVEDDGAGGMLVVEASGRRAGTLGDAALDAQVARLAAAAIDARRSKLEPVGSRLVFAEFLDPPPKLLICGAGDDARPIAACAASVGFRVTVVDHRRAYLTPERFPAARARLALRPEQATSELTVDRATYAVVKTHSLQRDTAWVQRLLKTDVPYVGVLGPRTRILKILHEAGTAGEGRIFGPIGLDLGADGPEQVALSVVAEVLAVASGRAPRHLREREGTLHARE